MKNLLLILALILISTCNIVQAAEDTHFKEEVLNIKSLSPEEAMQIRRDMEYRERQQSQMEQQAQDYMYRMQQQMMMPPAMNPYGGLNNFRY